MDTLQKKEFCKKDFSDLTELKEKYEVLRKKFNLPDFNSLNKVFDIEEIDSESDLLVRKIRRFLSEKLAGYMRFIEVLLNPSNAPIYFFKLIKKLDEIDRETLSVMYDKLGKIEIETISLDLNYNEEKEGEFIKKLYRLYEDDVRLKLLEILGKLGNGDNNKKKDNSGSYFG